VPSPPPPTALLTRNLSLKALPPTVLSSHSNHRHCCLHTQGWRGVHLSTPPPLSLVPPPGWFCAVACGGADGSPVCWCGEGGCRMYTLRLWCLVSVMSCFCGVLFLWCLVSAVLDGMRCGTKVFRWCWTSRPPLPHTESPRRWVSFCPPREPTSLLPWGFCGGECRLEHGWLVRGQETLQDSRRREAPFGGGEGAAAASDLVRGPRAHLRPLL